MIELAEQIFASGRVRDRHGNERELSSNTSRPQCEFLQGIIRELDAHTCLEIGLAQGISSLFICEELAGKTGAKLYSIDPFQSASGSVGIANLQRAGFESIIEFHEDYSHAVLPELLRRGVRLDFAYVDTTKLFDTVFVDAYYLSRLLRVGGIMAFDDCLWPGIKNVVRYLAKVPHLEIHGKFDVYQNSPLLKLAAQISRMIPYGRRFLNSRIIAPEETIGLNGHCVAFRKICEDNRPWDWFTDF